MSVDFPVPLGPTRATCRPASMSSEKFSSTLAPRLHSESSESYSKETLRKCSEADSAPTAAASAESRTAGGLSIIENRRRAAMIETRKSV